MPFVERPNELSAYGFALVQVLVELEMVVEDAAKGAAEVLAVAVAVVGVVEGVADEETVMEAEGPHPAEASRRHREFAYRTTCSRAGDREREKA